MRAVLQRVKEASVNIDCATHSKIHYGLLILLGITTTDTQEDINWLVQKIVGMRIFNDANGKMNLSVMDTNGEVLVVSQFTLFASTKKGNRPSFINSARPEIAVPLYENFLITLSRKLHKSISSGIFGADMKVALVNDGPVTIIMDSQNRQ